jgi:hypothetical protein
MFFSSVLVPNSSCPYGLGDLIRYWRIRIKVVLPVKLGLAGDLAVERERRFHGKLDRLLVGYRKHARMTEANRAGMGIRRRPEFGRASAEDFTVGRQLGVNLQADDGFVLAHVSYPLTHSGLRW